MKFTRDTFRYFDEAEKNKARRDWFALNKKLYETAVRAPFAEFLDELSHRLHHRLPGFSMHPRKILRPLRSERKAASRGHIRSSSLVFLQAKQTSHFEKNPGFYLHLGSAADDNEIGLGLYQPTSRQLKRLREAIANDRGELDGIVNSKPVQKYWGGMGGERYRRFPRTADPASPNAEYLMYKQFMLIRRFTRKEVMAPGFADLVLRAFEAGLPFLEWTREAVGLWDWDEWKRNRPEREEYREL